MPRLDPGRAAVADRTAASADEEAEPMPEGVYRVRLLEVTTKTLETSKEPKLVGCPMWTWAFEVSEGEHAGRRLWTRHILPPEQGYLHAAFMTLKFVEPFRAFGVPTDTDTTELIGKVCKAFVAVATASSGARVGQQVNALEQLMPDGPDEPDEQFDF